MVFCRVWWGESRREEVATRGVLKISQNTRENTCARVSFSIQLLAEATIKLLWKVAVVNLKIKYLQIYINFWLKMSSDQVIPKLFSNILRAASLTHFMLLLSFYTSWKHQKIIDFHKVKKVTWHKMGYRQIECLAINTPRRSLQQMYFKIDVLKNLSNFTGKKLCWNLFLIKLQDGMQLY